MITSRKVRIRLMAGTGRPGEFRIELVTPIQIPGRHGLTLHAAFSLVPEDHGLELEVPAWIYPLGQEHKIPRMTDADAEKTLQALREARAARKRS